MILKKNEEKIKWKCEFKFILTNDFKLVVAANKNEQQYSWIVETNYIYSMDDDIDSVRFGTSFFFRSFFISLFFLFDFFSLFLWNNSEQSKCECECEWNVWNRWCIYDWFYGLLMNESLKIMRFNCVFNWKTFKIKQQNIQCSGADQLDCETIDKRKKNNLKKIYWKFAEFLSGKANYWKKNLLLCNNNHKLSSTKRSGSN